MKPSTPQAGGPQKRTHELILLGVAAWLLGLANLLGQGTVYYQTQLTGSTLDTGHGTFSLGTNFFTYDIQAPYGFDQGQIRSPWPDTNAGVVFNLSVRGCVAPFPPDPGFCLYRGTFSLSDQQIVDLQTGSWFVTVTAFHTLSGQIVPVPEPYAAALLCFGLGAFRIFRRYQQIRPRRSRITLFNFQVKTTQQRKG